jgi:hypothetical protein
MAFITFAHFLHKKKKVDNEFRLRQTHWEIKEPQFNEKQQK